ncbi:MAG: hypothetical protein HY911_10915 [Desulfobacterales bacterium]|nr:hypothetical protein [Desulfobacterales bacterium]
MSALLDLGDWIRATLARGLHLDAGLLACLESTFGTPDPQVLLADMESGESASFLELIFFPDRATKHAYEVRWGLHAFSAASARDLAELLVRDPVAATLHMPGRNAPLRLMMPDFALRAFVQRLNIAWQPPRMLLEALDRHLDDVHRPPVRAILRHARLPWQPQQVELLDLFLFKTAPAADEFESDLTFLCGLLEEFAPDQDPFDFLMSKKRFYFQALCKAQAFDRRLRAGNMEILMLQGARAAHGDVAQWRSWMGQVDRISTALFGGTRYFQEPLAVDLLLDE